MPKYRQLHTKILESFDFAEMPNDFTRIVWILLMLILDSEGRGIYDMNWIKSKMFPMRPDIQNADIEQALTWMIEREMIEVYHVNDRSFFYVKKWHLYQSGTKKEAPSNLPNPFVVQAVQGDSGSSPDQVRIKSGTGPEQVRANAIQCNANTMQSKDDPAAAVFAAYMNNIGLITPIIQEKLEDDIQTYSAAWTVEAIAEASRQEKRSLAYVEGILKRWKREGKNSDLDRENVKSGGMKIYE